jgi:NAD(P)-dependent dehydrogenase (short-subunit alcohol dehydrogenase family)
MTQAHRRSRPMDGRTVLVTGGTGKATALGLARLGAHVVLSAAG